MIQMPPNFLDLDTYRREVFAPEDDLLKGIMPAAVARGLPDISVSPESGKTLFLLAKLINARKILEFGALAGYSGIWLARALPDDGKFISLEIEPGYAAIATKNYETAGIAHKSRILVGPATDHLASVAHDAPFDLVFIDADKQNYPSYLDFAMGHTRAGGLIIADNANGHGHVHEALEDGDGRKGIQIYNQKVARHPELVSNILPVGGWLAVSLVLGTSDRSP